MSVFQMYVGKNILVGQSCIKLCDHQPDLFSTSLAYSQTSTASS